ncbi:hypothetical protein LTR85_008856 [Meristemomyces frigidus]|nr:hypothetical protein LTR85_008856 [Meristemomyces frigidus]
MSYEQYRPPGRSNRSGRSQADNDVFEGLPVKQWGQQFARVSLAPPASENADGKEDKWGEPPMPRDSNLLQPWTQQLLRLARSGKVGTKRKPDPDSMDEDRPDEEAAEDAKSNLEDRGYVARKWKPVPEALLEPEHRHFEFLAKRRRGLPSMYGPELSAAAVVPMRRTKVQKSGPDGEVKVYEVLVPEGQTVEGEVTESTELAEVKAVAAVPGTVIEGVGIANEDGVVVAEHLKPSVAPRRNRPPPKKKGGPGRGKKRVTFTNPDGSTYTTIVPNATKIVPQPGQVVKHVAKGEEANPDVVAAETSVQAPTGENPDGEGEGEGEEEGSEDGEEGDDDDDDREEGELSEEDAPTAGVTPAPPTQSGEETADTTAKLATETSTKASTATLQGVAPARDASSSPELPLAKTSHSRQASLAENVQAAPGNEDAPEVDMAAETDAEKFEDGEEDLLGNLMKDLEGDQAADD